MRPTTVSVLDSGYATLIETWGTDERIIEAARMSTGKGFQGWGKAHSITCLSLQSEDRPPLPCDCGAGAETGDEKLLNYLYKHKHMTPFEMCGMVIEVKAPIFVFREWHRHRTQSYNEMSARYIPLPDDNYMPTIARLVDGGAKTGNRQASSTGALLDDEKAHYWKIQLHEVYAHAQRVYEQGLAAGVPKELARLCLPVGRYSRMRASANLRNWLAFLTLRMDATAQQEIRAYAEAVAALIKDNFPRTWEVYQNNPEVK